jgi:microcystin-dependent protein
MAEPFLGEIRPVSFNYAPSGWAECNGQLLTIIQNPLLFQLIGTTYGGDGQTTFGLPDLRRRGPLHKSQDDDRLLGSSGGAETVTLTGEELPAHTHSLQATTQRANSKSPGNNVDAYGGSYHDPSTLTPMASQAIGSAGGGQPHANMQPFLVLNYIISLQGTYPTPG